MSRIVIIWTICFLALISNSYGQIYLTKKNLKWLFEIDYAHEWNNPQWIACNQDSSYFTSDTIKLYKIISQHSYLDCCEYVIWHFDVIRMAYLISTKISCPEPTIDSLIVENCKLKFKTLNKDLFIMIYQQTKLINKFEVISIDYINLAPKVKVHMLTLIRNLKG